MNRFFLLSSVSVFLFASCLLSAQELRYSMPPCDSVVVDDGQGHRSVTLIPQAVVPSKSESTSDNIVNRRQFTTIEEILKEQELQDRRMREGQRSVQTRDLSAYSTGSIPIEESISPSGGRIYSVPIPTASGWNLTPGISLVYNSQGGNNIAGYGWGLSGLPSITVRNSNLYYDGVVRGGVYDSMNQNYALDGIPIVQSETGLSGYGYATAKGNIQIKKYLSAYGRTIYFSALYPDGSRATFGFTDSTGPHISYPITELTDKNGNTITFDYDIHGNTYYVTGIHYGTDATIEFIYIPQSNSRLYKYAIAGLNVDFPQWILKTVTSKDGNDVICRYSLTHETLDGVSLLKKIQCHSGSSEVPPLLFTYGIDSEPGHGSPSFEVTETDFATTYYTKSSTVPLQYHRGKLIPGCLNDGIIVLPSYSTYAEIEKTWRWGWQHHYGSTYNASQSILCNFTGIWSSVQKTIPVGEGFQLIEAVDVDGDGVDELVKINNNSVIQDVTTYTVTIYSFDANANYTSTNFSVNVNDGAHNTVYNNPAKSYYRFGNFRGDGKTMLLIMTKGGSKFALVDLDAHSLLSETSLFTIDDVEKNLVFTADFENDGKTDLCHVTDNGVKVYSLSNSSSTSFSLRTTYSGVTTSQLYTDPQNISSQEKALLLILDTNGDGYQDIASATGYDVETGKFTVNSQTWNFARFNGKAFSTETSSLDTRYADDTVMFLDVDGDGLPDYFHLHNSQATYITNSNGQFTGSPANTGLTLDSTTDFIPSCSSVFGKIGDFITMSGPITKVYDYSINHAIRRSLETLTDSFGIVHTNTYGNTGEYSGVYLTDNTRTYSSADGYKRIHNPLTVLWGSYKYLGYQLIGSEGYMYWDQVYHSRGLGFCGFGKIVVSDYSDPDNYKYTTSVLNPEKFGVAEQIYSSKTYNGSPYTSVVNTYDNHSTTYGKLNPRLTSSVALDYLSTLSTTTTYSYGNFDYPDTIITKKRFRTGSARTDSVYYSYVHSVSPSMYILGVVTEESLVKEGDGNGGMSWKEKSVVTYDSLYRPVTSKKYVGRYGSGYDATNLVSETRWVYDTNGNVISEKSAPYDATEFIGNTFAYDNNGRYLVSETDALGHTTSYSGYNKFGKPSTVTDYRGRVTTYTYDNWGNVVSVSYPDNSVEQATVAWGGTGLYTVTSTATGQPESVTHYDALGRELHSGVKRFDGQWQWVDKEYNERGLLTRVSLPYRGQSAVYWNNYQYDEYYRPDSIIYASGKLTRWIYNGRTVTTVKDGIASSKSTDPDGNLISVSDAGGTITYNLRDDGQPSFIIAPGNATTTFEYDEYGRRTGITDPSAGVQTDSFSCESDGRTSVFHSSPNGWTETYWDKYGRVTLIERSEDIYTSYSYDSYGRPITEMTSNGTSKEYTYDNLDRIASIKETAPDGKWLKKDYSYGAGSVLASVTYISQTDTITTETYSYANGYNTGITITGGTVVWSLTSENDLGLPTGITTGTVSREYGYTPFGLPTSRGMDDGDLQDFSYQIDAQTGNLLVRGDGNNNQTETFGYDNLNRLTSIGSRQITYASNGNIVSMDGVGTMAYTSTGHPYQITSLTPAASGLVQGRQQNVTYTSYNRPSLLTEGGRSAAFTYNGDGDRVKMNVADSTGNVLTRYYIGGRYECDLTTSGTKERLYLGGDAYSAPMVYQRENNGSWTLYNIGRDYLGSITHIATADGTLVAEYSYDPWGRLRNPATLQIYAAGSEPELFLGRGYTGHEHLTWFGLINMNARLYDPLLGRFLSPDPYVQAPDFTQNFNRYSYALNNPLKYSDESGEFFVVDSWLIGLIGGGLPRANQMAKNDLKIWGGLFTTDKNKGFWGQTIELLSRFTYQAEQTWMGFLAAQTINTFHLVGGVKSVEYLHGATVVSTKKGSWGAFTLGSFITGGNELHASNSNELFQHEYGHYLQSQALGPMYLSKVAIPSAFSKNTLMSPHNSNPAEQDANIRAFNYFKKYYPGDFDKYDPSTGQYDGQWVWKKSVSTYGYYHNIVGLDWLKYRSRSKYNDSVLSISPIEIQWYDVVLSYFPTFIIGKALDGWINRNIYNQMY
ncbi:MAG: hypothetical protein K6A64_00695 [Bacteroidales bacterium]|nr:hypothetical protein [Bacteroidales bacterium]